MVFCATGSMMETVSGRPVRTLLPPLVAVKLMVTGLPICTCWVGSVMVPLKPLPLVALLATVKAVLVWATVLPSLAVTKTLAW